MTLEIVEFRCPTCGHPVGEEEYRKACEILDNKVEDICQERMLEQEEKHRQEMLEQEEKNNREREIRVVQEVKLQKNKILSEQEEKSKKEKALITEKYEQEIKIKNEEITAAKLQNKMHVEEKIEEALRDKEERYSQREATHQLQISRIEEQNRGLADQVQRLQKTLENIPPEVRGTSAEINPYEDLHKAFPQDGLVKKTVGAEMPDVVQTVVTESGERISTPILWDPKTGESITTKDIEKAKRYKEKYNTDDCILVTATGIAAKDTKNRKAGFIGKRDGILLVHKSVAVAIAEETRNCIIKNARLVKNSIGRSSKQVELYDYITSPMRFRRIQKKFENKLKLEEVIRKQEDYNKKAWNEQKKIIKETFEFDTEDEEKIKDITQEDKDNE
jgi:hypothetical protein